MSTKIRTEQSRKLRRESWVFFAMALVLGVVGSGLMFMALAWSFPSDSTAMGVVQLAVAAWSFYNVKRAAALFFGLREDAKDAEREHAENEGLLAFCSRSDTHKAHSYQKVGLDGLYVVKCPGR